MAAFNVDEASLRRWQFLADVGLWPRMIEFNWQGWLRNFDPLEQKYAARLLDSFLYFSQPLTRQLFRSAFQQVSGYVCDKSDYMKARRQWEQFVDGVMVVRISGEQPSEADSGFAFARLSRDDLQLDAAQLVSAKIAIARLSSAKRGGVVFVDDFVGSGRQFLKTWARREDMGVGRPARSFSDVARESKDIKFFYCTAVATDYGIREIARVAPSVRVCSGQRLDDRASAITTPSLVWRDDMGEDGPDFVESVSKRAKIPDTEGDEDDWRGYHKLGLSIAFAHGWPDANLGVYIWDQEGWTPLLRKGAL